MGFLVSFVFAVDSKIQIPQSTALVRQSSSKFKLFLGLNGALIATKAVVCVHASINFMDNQLENLSVVYRSLLKPGIGWSNSGMFHRIPVPFHLLKYGTLCGLKVPHRTKKR